MSKRKAHNRRSFRKIFFKFVGVFITIGIVSVGGIFIYYAKDLPDLDNINTAIRSPSVEIQSYNGTTLGTFGDLYENVVSIRSLPKHVTAAFIAI